MAYIEKRQRADGRSVYRVRIRVKGSPDISTIHDTFKQAKAWAQKKETEIRETRYFPKDLGKEPTFADGHAEVRILPLNLFKAEFPPSRDGIPVVTAAYAR